MRRSTKFLLILFLLPLMARAQDACKITYISNEGFLLEVSGKKVLIDGLFDQIEGDWCDSPTKETVDLMEASAPPFDQVDLIAITHKHQDHFSAKVVVNHLLNNPSGKVVCPSQVVEVLKQNPDYEKIKDQITSLTPKELSDSIVMLAGISIRVLRLEHSHYMEEDSTSGEMKNRHRDIENLGFLFNIDGVKIFHCGDTNPLNQEEYSTYALHKDSIDLAFLERMFVGRGAEGMAMINDYIQPSYTVFMHIGPGNREAFVNYFREVDNTTIFEEKMETLRLELKP
jgi:L-ascorbate metabolism protein UlaG (beta-lactamase superfamily)